jgi:hypothetical protein
MKSELKNFLKKQLNTNNDNNNKRDLGPLDFDSYRENSMNASPYSSSEY